MALAVSMTLLATIPITAEAATYTPRITTPTDDNRYYRHTSAGGLNECIQITGGSVLPNCVGYAWGRAYEITGTRPSLSKGSAKAWYGTNDGYARGSAPKLGAIMCWSDDKTGNGHVAVVEEINASGQIRYSQSFYDGAKFGYTGLVAPLQVGAKSTYLNKNKETITRTFQGYIYVYNGEAEQYATIPDGTYTIQGKSGKYVVPTYDPAKGNGVFIYPENIVPGYGIAGDFRWEFTRLSDGSYRIVNQWRQQALDVANASTASGAKIQMCNWNDSAAQHWYIYDCGNGWYRFAAKCSGLTLDVVGNGTANGTALQQYANNGSDAQRFKLAQIVPPSPTPTLSSVSITTLPSKTSYTQGETLNTAGLTLTAKYSDNSTKTLTSGFTCSPAIMNSVGEQTVTVSYAEGSIVTTTKFAVTVNPVPVLLEEIAVAASPNKTTYTAGEALDLAGLAVSASYSNGSSKSITGYTTNPANGAELNAVGTQTVTISYAEGGINKTAGFSITVNKTPGTETALISVTPSAVVKKLNGSQNELTITVTEQYSDLSSKTVTATFNINNNSSGVYSVGAHKVYVGTKANTQISDCYLAG